MSDTATTSLKLEASIKDRVRRLADARQRSSHWLMKEAIEQYVDREEKREKVRLDVMATWEHYQETGLHLTAQEADAWLEKLAAGEDADVPECHTCHGRLRPWRTSVDLVAFCVPKAPTPPAEQ